MSGFDAEGWETSLLREQRNIVTIAPRITKPPTAPPIILPIFVLYKNNIRCYNCLQTVTYERITNFECLEPEADGVGDADELGEAEGFVSLTAA
jgi:hypothetical protein